MDFERLLRNPLARMAILALATASCWWGWMGWDTAYDRDPVTGRASGPYQPWQVISCVLCLVVVAVLATRRINPVAVVGLMSTTFTLSWTASAFWSSGAGPLWGVGATMILIGMLAGSALVAGVAAEFWAPRRRAPSPPSA